MHFQRIPERGVNRRKHACTYVSAKESLLRATKCEETGSVPDVLSVHTIPFPPILPRISSSFIPHPFRSLTRIIMSNYSPSSNIGFFFFFFFMENAWQKEKKKKKKKNIHRIDIFRRLENELQNNKSGGDMERAFRRKYPGGRYPM